MTSSLHRVFIFHLLCPAIQQMLPSLPFIIILNLWQSPEAVTIALLSSRFIINDHPSLSQVSYFFDVAHPSFFVVFLFSSAHWSDINVFSCQSDIWYKCFDPLQPLIWIILLGGICCVCFLLFVLCSSWLICIAFLIIALTIVQNSALYASNGITPKTRMKLRGIHIFHLQCKNIWVTTQCKIRKYG